MNIELKPRTTPFSIPASASANDNFERGREPSPRPRALIYKPAKSAMTSGRAATKQWLLEFEPQSPLFIEPLMGWTSSTDPMSQVRLTFPTREAAVAFAKRHGLDYEVREPATPVTTGASVDQRDSQPSALWPLELLLDGNRVVVPEIDVMGFVPNVAT